MITDVSLFENEPSYVRLKAAGGTSLWRGGERHDQT